MKSFGAFAAILFAGSLVSNSAVASVEGLLVQCKSVSNAIQRLACYDKLATNLQNAGVPAASYRPALPTQSAVQSPATPNVAPQPNYVPENEFGLEHKRPVETMSDTMVAAITQLSADPYGKKKLVLDNGTVWKQADASRLKLKEGQKVTIKRGVLGAFYLTVDGLNRSMKVKRTD